jgi:hypothetical protein
MTWSIVDPLLDTYPSALTANAAWWCAKGPTILKIPITALPTVGGSGSDFIRGENVVQTTTGFEGEILSYVWDNISAGYLVVSPRLRGTGSGRYGIDAYTITGSWSGATISGANIGTTLEFREEVTFWKAGASSFYNGSIFRGFFDVVNDGYMYSTLFGNAGCTAVVAPGGGGGTNTFPTYGYLVRGTTTSGGHVSWSGDSTNSFLNGGVIAVDCIEEQNYSADGSHTLFYANISSGSTECHGFSFQRLNNIEDGDIYPYVSLDVSYGTVLYTNNRTVCGTAVSLAQYGGFTPLYSSINTGSIFNNGAAYTTIRGWRRRSLTSSGFQDFDFAILYAAKSLVLVSQASITTPEAVISLPFTSRVRDTIWVVSVQSGYEMRKGTLKWIYFVQMGERFDTYDSKRWLQMGSGYFLATSPAVIVGPWDGSTVQTVN